VRVLCPLSFVVYPRAARASAVVYPARALPAVVCRLPPRRVSASSTPHMRRWVDTDGSTTHRWVTSLSSPMELVSSRLSLQDEKKSRTRQNARQSAATFMAERAKKRGMQIHEPDPDPDHDPDPDPDRAAAAAAAAAGAGV
jgi:hypothetical protein